MKFAEAEQGKNIREIASDDEFIRSMRTALAVEALERQIEDFGQGALQLVPNARPLNPGGYRLLTKVLPNPARQLLGRMEADSLRRVNPEITKYFEGVKTDPVYDKKGRSFTLSETYESGGSGHVTAWCAAFVNWCLKQAGAPHLGYATAKSWLEFGTPLAHPDYGCLTVIKPSSSTGSTTGHVAFFVRRKGNNVELLGGNQSDKVSVSAYKESKVLGYRWPTTMSHYLLGTTGILT